MNPRHRLNRSQEGTALAVPSNAGKEWALALEGHSLGVFLPAWLVIMFLTLGISTMAADEPRFINAKLETSAVGQSLESTVQTLAAGAQQPAWIAYSVDAVAGHHSVCCGNGDWDRNGSCGTCILEKGSAHSSVVSNDNPTVKLEGAAQLVVLLRVEGKRVMRVRVASAHCTLDAGGLRVVWLTGAKPEESVSLLAKFVTGDATGEDKRDSLGNSALTAVALHAGSFADRALESFVSSNRAEWLRKEAAFWLGEARGAAGLRALQKMAQGDPSPHVREQVTFALSVSSEPGALTEMIRMAHEDGSAEVRGQALFWLAQKAGKKAVSAITGAIENDPDTEVKKKAVFALSQMPEDEGVPKLIEVAQTNRNPEVRKQAFFWLGQSEDPRALAFFEKVLTQ
jgi:hypothetical protein